MADENPFEFFMNFEIDTKIKNKSNSSQFVLESIQDLHYVINGLLLNYRIYVVGEIPRYLQFLKELFEYFHIQKINDMFILSEGRCQNEFRIQAFQSTQISTKCHQGRTIVVELNREQAYGQVSMYVNKQISKNLKFNQKFIAAQLFWDKLQSDSKKESSKQKRKITTIN